MTCRQAFLLPGEDPFTLDTYVHFPDENEFASGDDGGHGIDAPPPVTLRVAQLPTRLDPLGCCGSNSLEARICRCAAKLG